MRRLAFVTTLFLLAGTLSGCKVKKHLDIVEANQNDATIVLQYEHAFERYVIDVDRAEDDVLELCATWGYSAAEFSHTGIIECIEEPKRNVTGARPPGQSEEPGMGTAAAERERSRRSIGTVGMGIGTDPSKFDYGCTRWRVSYIGHCIEPRM